MEGIAPAALMARVSELREANRLPLLRKQYRYDASGSSDGPLSDALWVCHVLGIAMPDLYQRDDVPGSIAAIPSMPPASIAGRHLGTFSRSELRFLLGSHFAVYRSGHYISVLYATPEELDIAFRAALGIAGAAQSTFQSPPGFASVADTQTALLAHLEPLQLASLRHTCKALNEHSESTQMATWLRTLRFTEDRAGLLLGQDLSVARKLIAMQPTRPWMPTAGERMSELYAFVVSEEHARLRQALGVSLNRSDTRDPYTGETLPSAPLELPKPPAPAGESPRTVASRGQFVSAKWLLFLALALLGLLGYWVR